MCSIIMVLLLMRAKKEVRFASLNLVVSIIPFILISLIERLRSYGSNKHCSIICGLIQKPILRPPI